LTYRTDSDRKKDCLTLWTTVVLATVHWKMGGHWALDKSIGKMIAFGLWQPRTSKEAGQARQHRDYAG
jgi:hypothetical protein